MLRRWYGACALTAVVTSVTVGCSDVADQPSAGTPPPTRSSTPSTGPTTSPPPSTPGRTSPPTVTPSVRRPATAVRVSIPKLRRAGMRVVAYTGTADDRPGTVIQDRGVLASPRGPRGGVGPGEIGNFIVTGHRTTHGRPLGRLPELRTGDHVLVTADGTVYDYVIVRTMTISFRRPAEIAAQNAPVPGRPGIRPTRAMLTLSTCATPEDHAQGNYWKDALGNPEHRINKIAVLTATRPA
ncbi:class E sortase [Kribbella amoyensis]|uniref:class E sortase n=1 Tax=Kribbella amoyensis TaxID=996641 RepID=UPI001EE3151E|nr:class E sortase [Kribbella amoyensis]